MHRLRSRFSATALLQKLLSYETGKCATTPSQPASARRCLSLLLHGPEIASTAAAHPSSATPQPSSTRARPNLWPPCSYPVTRLSHIHRHAFHPGFPTVGPSSHGRPCRALASGASPAVPTDPHGVREGGATSGGGQNTSPNGCVKGAGSESGRRRQAVAHRSDEITKHYDVIVVGLGAFGSSVLYHLARAGLRVAGVEKHRPVGHSLGSSHGASRIIRLAYFEGLQYGPLLKQSLRLFLELQDELAAVQGPLAEGPLFLRTGMLDVGSVFSAALKSAQAHGLQHEVLSGSELNRRFPAYRVPEHWQALYQPDGGVLAPERIVQAYVRLAQRQGAEVLQGQTLVSWRPEGSSHGSPVTFQLTPTDPRDASSAAMGGPRTITASAAVLAPGPWIGQLVPELRELCVPERQVVGWFEIEPGSRHHFAPDRFPVFVLEEAPGGAAYYGFPEHGGMPGFKIGLYRHLREEIRDPADLDRVRRSADAADEATLRAGLLSYFPAAARGRLLSASTCFFTNTPDGHFLVDRHPRYPQVILCSACSGHGFKMSSGIGQLIARMVLAGPGAAPIPGPCSAPKPSPAPTSGTLSPWLTGSGLALRASGRGAEGGDGDADAGWRELLPFRFSPGQRPGHREALERFF